MKRKAVKVDEPGERIKDIYMVNEGETSRETAHGDSEEEEEKEDEPNVENNASRGLQSIVQHSDRGV